MTCLIAVQPHAGNGFSEGDQAALWQACTDAQSRSHQGLGQADAPKKVAGARWAGVRTRLGSDTEPDSGSESEVDGGSESREGMGTQAVIVPSKCQQALEEEMEQPEGVHALEILS